MSDDDYTEYVNGLSYPDEKWCLEAVKRMTSTCWLGKIDAYFIKYLEELFVGWWLTILLQLFS